MKKKEFPHACGMVDVSAKEVTKRTAVAGGAIRLSSKAFTLFLKKGSPKGDVLEAAKMAGIMAAKACPQIVPYCHPLELQKIRVNFKVDKKKSLIAIQAEVNCMGRTGVEMEALCAASAAALTIYDMMKWADKAMVISDVKLLYKSGGRSGTYRHKSFIE